MSQDTEGSRPRFPNWIFPVVGILFFFTLVGSISTYMPTLSNDFQTFFQDFTLATVPNTGITFPAPSTPGLHLSIYAAAALFCLAWGVFAIVMLVVRMIARSPPWKTAEEFFSMVWWFGAWFLINMFLTATATLTSWFSFWAAIIMLIGASLMIRGVVIAAIR